MHIVAASGTTNTLTDSEKNNDDNYPDNEDAENAVLKCKDGSQVTISGSGTLKIIANGKNSNQIAALSDNVEMRMHQNGIHNERIEGNKNSTWILMDYKDVIVHVFSPEDRLFYDLERIWKDGKKISREEL